MKGLARQFSSEDRLTQVLFVLVLGLGLLVVSREFPRLFRADGPSPTAHLLSGWEAARDIGLRVGPENAEVQIVEFVDVQCPACREMHVALEEVLRRYPGRVSLTLVHFPLPYHGSAVPGAIALECAAEQEVTAQMARALFEDQKGLGTRSWLEYAKRAGVSDTDRFASCLVEPAHRSAVDEGAQAGRDLGVGYTPTLIVNGWVLAERPDWTVSDLEIPAIGIGAGPVRAHFTESGRLAILSSYDATILVLTTHGVVERVIGGYGEGPKSFGVILEMVPAGGDSVVLLDARNARIATVDVATGSIGTVPFPDGVAPGHLGVIGVLPGRGYLIHGFGRVREVREGARVRPLAPWGLVGYDRSWTSWQEVPDAETEMLSTRYGGQQGREPVEVHWGARTFAVVSGGFVHSVESALAEIVTRDWEGKILRRVRLDLPPRAVTPSMRSVVTARRLAQLDMLVEPVFDVEESRRVIRVAPFADTLRGIDRLLVSPEGVIWVLPVVAPGDTVWQAVGLNSDGTVVGTIGGPANVVPVAIGGGSIVGVTEEPDGSRTLRRWQVVRR
ncbi:MAG: thioredoxin domain-containing protein [Gemmatimonadales bacterium]|nr:thioredoxin domain-containing protein [Gemmatimonadales bacterium]